MSRQNRRDFLKRTAVGGLAAATFAVAGTKTSGRVLGANERLRVAVAGINSRGQDHIHAFGKAKGVEVAYLVDPDSRLFAARSKWLQDNCNAAAPRCVADLRQVLDDKDLDIVSIASPHHWHALLAIWACQAGKDVYVEKPCCHNVFEGRKLVEAARKYDRIVQHGTQSRSEAEWINQVAAARSGKYGKLLISYGYASKPRRTIGFRWPKAPPTELDFNVWLGPAPMQPYHDNLVHYNWHWFWDFGNGEIGNQGVHQMDIARWVMPDGAAPTSVISLGGRYGYQTQDQGQTANTQFTVIDFGGPKLMFEDRGLVDRTTAKVTNEFHMEEGVIRDNKFYPKGQTTGEPLPDVAPEETKPHPAPAGTGKQPPAGTLVYDPYKHFANFLDCVRSRKRENLRAEIREGYLSAQLCHLANTSYRLGKEVPFHHKPAFGDDKAANEAFEGMKENLHAAGVKLDGSVYQLGRQLAFDAKADRFVDDEEANGLLTRPYRAPFVVPEQV